MNPHAARKITAANSYPPQSGPLAEVNLGFHETYNRLVDESMVQFGEIIPVIALVGDDLHLMADGGQQTERVLPERYHELKCFGHVAFGLQLALMGHANGSLSPLARAELEAKRLQIAGAQTAIEELEADQRAAPTKLLDLSETLINRVLEHGAVQAAELHDYALNVGPAITELAALAVRLEIDLLHTVVSKWRAELGEERWRVVQVVICDNHQLRYRHAARQYFGRLLSEREGIAAELEDHILFGEGIKDVDGALDLLARHRIDQRASRLLFGERRRLQEDLLADVAAEYLDQVLPAGES